MDSFKKGDMVKHKTGGTVMCVRGVSDTGGLLCRWAYGSKDDQQFRQEDFYPEELELAKSEGEKRTSGAR